MAFSKTISTIIVFLLLAACVTINVYFPEAAADSAARTIVRDVVGKTEVEIKQEVPAQDNGAAITPADSQKLSAATVILNLFVSSAHAAEADININTPVINQIRASLKARQPQMQPFFQSGALGLTRDGLIGVHNPAAIPLKDRNRVKKLVADDNRDRNALYKEIAKANGHPEWEGDIRRTFAKVWVEEFPPKTWYQGGTGSWQQK